MEGAVDIIYRTLEKTGLIHDEGPDKTAAADPMSRVSVRLRVFI